MVMGTDGGSVVTTAPTAEQEWTVNDMRHCKNCKNCVLDLRAMLDLGLCVEKCRVDGHLILRPFWSGLRCKNYKRGGGGK